MLEQRNIRFAGGKNDFIAVCPDKLGPPGGQFILGVQKPG